MGRMRSDFAIIGAGVTVVLIAALNSTPSQAGTDPDFFELSNEQLQLAARIAMDETSPTQGAATAGTQEKGATSATGLPSNVSTVRSTGSHRRAVTSLVGAKSAPDDVQVIVVQMTGSFSVQIPAPPGSPTHATGTVMTIVADAQTGQMLDFGLTGPSSAPVLPHSQTLLSR